MYVVIETNSWCDDEGAYLFNTFKEAFDYLVQQFNPVFEGWEEDKREKWTNANKPLTDEDRVYFEERYEDDNIAYWCVDSDKIWSNGIHLVLYKVHDRRKWK